MNAVALFPQIPPNPRSTSRPSTRLLRISGDNKPQQNVEVLRAPSRSVSWSNNVEFLQAPSRSVTWSTHVEVFIIPARESRRVVKDRCLASPGSATCITPASGECDERIVSSAFEDDTFTRV
jgi:hypothetical protein